MNSNSTPIDFGDFAIPGHLMISLAEADDGCAVITYYERGEPGDRRDRVLDITYAEALERWETAINHQE